MKKEITKKNLTELRDCYVKLTAEHTAEREFDELIEAIETIEGCEVVDKIISDYDKIKQFVDELEQGAYVLRQPLRFETRIEDQDLIKHLEQMVKDGIFKKRYKLYCSNCDKEGDFLYDDGQDIDEQCSKCDGAFDETYQVTTHYKKI